MEFDIKTWKQPKTAAALTRAIADLETTDYRGDQHWLLHLALLMNAAEEIAYPERHAAKVAAKRAADPFDPAKTEDEMMAGIGRD